MFSKGTFGTKQNASSVPNVLQKMTSAVKNPQESAKSLQTPTSEV
jgi:hypothetical protein